MTGVTLRSIGSIDLADLATMCEAQGHEYLPYPFVQARPSRQDTLTADRSSSDDFTQDDPRILRKWLDTYTRADIWVECRVIYSNDETPDVRILAFRAGEPGFIATQRQDEDIVDVLELSAYKLGAAMASSVGLARSGSQSRIVIPKYVNYFRNTVNDVVERDYEFSVLRPVGPASANPSATVVPDGDVSALAVVQSHCQPARTWGVDWTKKLAAWVQISDDGDYIYTPDCSHAVPVTESDLSDRIDRLIADDVAILRQRRRTL